MQLDPLRSRAAEPPPLSKAPFYRHIAWRISIFYLVFGLLWIFFSDWALNLFPMEFAIRFQSIKGAVFILLTALLLYFLVRRFVMAMEKADRKMQHKLQGIAE